MNGTSGLTAAADAVLVLTRKRHGNEGKLFVSGRDVEERSLNLFWNPQYCLWSPLRDDGPDANLPDDRRAPLNVLHSADRPLNLQTIADRLRKTYAAASMLASRLVTDGLIVRQARGLYRLPDPVDSVESLKRVFPN